MWIFANKIAESVI